VELAHASAHTNIKSPKLLAFGDGNKTQILAKHVDVIDWRNNKTHFKFAWKIQRSVQRIFMFGDRKSTRLNSSHVKISYAVFCLKKKTYTNRLIVRRRV